jgi:hypothetical protein
MINRVSVDIEYIINPPDESHNEAPSPKHPECFHNIRLNESAGTEC